MKIILNIIILFNLTNLGILFAETKCSPIINSNSFWKEFDNNQVINCDFNECFPKNLVAPLVCDARCLFTNEGYGTPEALLVSFLDKVPPSEQTNAKFIVAYGPPASGKSEILPVLQRELGDDFSNMDKTTILVNVDDIFQKGKTGEKYKIYRNNIITKYKADSRNYTQRLYQTYRWIADSNL